MDNANSPRAIRTLMSFREQDHEPGLMFPRFLSERIVEQSLYRLFNVP